MDTETVRHIICCCELLARHPYNFFGKLFTEPKDISRASVRDLCLFIRGTGLLNLCGMDCLGLHNKPKAAVHPEHQPMGPIGGGGGGGVVVVVAVAVVVVSMSVWYTKTG
jgi:hypothetical protein